MKTCIICICIFFLCFLFYIRCSTHLVFPLLLSLLVPSRVTHTYALTWHAFNHMSMVNVLSIFSLSFSFTFHCSFHLVFPSSSLQYLVLVVKICHHLCAPSLLHCMWHVLNLSHFSHSKLRQEILQKYFRIHESLNFLTQLFDALLMCKHAYTYCNNLQLTYNKVLA